MNRKLVIIAGIALIGALAISAFSSIYLIRSKSSQSAVTTDLTSLNAEEVLAFRWEAIARYYEAHQASLNLNSNSYVVDSWVERYTPELVVDGWVERFTPVIVNTSPDWILRQTPYTAKSVSH